MSAGMSIHDIPPGLPARSRAALVYMLSVRGQLQAANHGQLYAEFLTVFQEIYDGKVDVLSAADRIIEIMAYAGCPELLDSLNTIFDNRLGYRIQCTTTHVVVTKPTGATKILRAPSVSTT